MNSEAQGGAGVTTKSDGILQEPSPTNALLQTPTLQPQISQTLPHNSPMVQPPGLPSSAPFNYYDPNQFQMYYNQYFQLPFSQYYNYQYYSNYFTQQQSTMGQPLPPGVTTACRSLYVGNLSEKISEPLLNEIFSALGPLESCKLIKDKNSGDSSGYGFVDYFDHKTAALALQCFNGRAIYGSELKVNWAFANGQKEDTSTHYHIFVGDLSMEVDDKALYTAFSPFGSISDARVMIDPAIQKSRGYGFVAFRKRDDAQRALIEMNGEWMGTRAIRCNWANQKGANGPPEDLGGASSGLPSSSHMGGSSGGSNTGGSLEYNVVLTQAPQSNTTVYIGNITAEISESQLRQVFGEFGQIEEIKVQHDKGFSFIRFRTHESAAQAISQLSGKQLGSRIVKCSWGKERVGMPTMPPMIPRMG